MDTQLASSPAGAAASPGLAPGQMLKHFRIDGLLGEGGMGLVYRAYDTRLHRAVAVKILSAELTSHADRKQRFLQEAHAAASINHHAVAQIYDADEQEGLTFIVMELVEGKTVRQLIQSRDLDLLGVIDIGIQVCDGLGRAHELGIVHRDVKPANIMRTADGHVKILDFGLAKLLGAKSITTAFGLQRSAQVQYAVTRPSIVMGTPAYMSPEQVRGLPVDARTDIFGVGVLLFEMVTGRSPFQRENPMDALHAAAFEEAPPMKSIRPNVPDELQQIVSHCLKKEPEQRYANARLLADDLRRIRRDTEAGITVTVPWQQRLVRAWHEFRALPPARYASYALGLLGVVLVLYVSLSKFGLVDLILLGLGILFVYRTIRNRPHTAQAILVKQLSKIPEVRLVVFDQQHAKIAVDCVVPQLYGRINDHLRDCNRKLFFGAPMTVSILSEVPPVDFQRLLSGPGVQYVRADALQKQREPPPPLSGTAR